jgi:carboxyl-terminal processing protease
MRIKDYQLPDVHVRGVLFSTSLLVFLRFQVATRPRTGSLCYGHTMQVLGRRRCQYRLHLISALLILSSCASSRTSTLTTIARPPPLAAITTSPKLQLPPPQVHLRGMVQAMEVIASDFLANPQKVDSVQGGRGQLDQFSVYLGPQRYKEMIEDTHGEYASVGLTIGPGAIDDAHPSLPPYPWIDDVQLESPAHAAGLAADDRLVAVDGAATTNNGKEVYDASVWETRLRGDAGTVVTVTILRAGGTVPVTIKLQRQMLQISSITAKQLASGIGYIAVHRFADPTASNLQQELERFAHLNIHSLILDLRGNSGGLITSATAVADLFLDNGIIVTIESRRDRQVSLATPPTIQNSFGSSVTMVCLVDNKTASASEIVAAALQQHGRAKLVGEHTYGKGSVQTFYTLSDGAALKLTTARYLTPNGKTIDPLGLTPDIMVLGFASADIVVAGPTSTATTTTKNNPTPKQTGARSPDDAKLAELERDDPQLAAALLLAKNTARIHSKK